MTLIVFSLQTWCCDNFLLLQVDSLVKVMTFADENYF